MTAFLIALGIVVLGFVAGLIFIGLLEKMLSGLDPRDWEE